MLTTIHYSEQAMAFQFKKTRDVTLQTLKLKKGVEYFLKFLTPMGIGKEIKNSNMGPATVMQAINLETGEKGIVLCPTILQKELAEAYGDESYVGRCFSVVLYKIPEKRYTGVTISEVSDPTEDPAWQAEVAVTIARRKAEAQGIDPDTGEVDADDTDEDVKDSSEEMDDPMEEATVSAPAPAPKGGNKRRR